MYSPEVLEKAAEAAHEVNRTYCRFLGDASQPPWSEAPDWQKESARNGVKLHAENPNLGPESSHESWMREKLEAGWRHGPVKDPEKKEHPCLVPFNQLPLHQQMKDAIFLATVHGVLASPE